MATDRVALMRECLDDHLADARARLNRSIGGALALAMIPAAILGVLAGNLAMFLACAPFFLVLVAAWPLAVWYGDVHRVARLRRRFEARPQCIAHVADLRLRVNGTSVRRATVKTDTGEMIGLLLPPERIARLTAVYPSTESFGAILARL